MEFFLEKVTSQAMNYAIRSGISITSGYAIQHCSRLLSAAPKSSAREELARLQTRLESKIRIISPAIDMIELIAARGNTTLESAVNLTKDIRWAIQDLGTRLNKAADDEELFRRGSSRAKSKEQTDLNLKLIVSDIKKLLERIEDAVPLINLAITTSGVNLSTNLPATVSPSRLLQASTFLTAGDSQYTAYPGYPIQIGPTYTLSVYMLFAGHAWRPHEEESIRETTWKEAIHKARVKLLRVPFDQLYELPSNEKLAQEENHDGLPSNHIPGEAKAFEFAYQLLLIEDLNDDRVHDAEDTGHEPGPFDDVALAGIRDVIPIHEISKIFYADTGKILNIGMEGEVNNPILLLKRDVSADPPRRMVERRKSFVSFKEEEVSGESDSKFPESPSKEQEQSELDAQLHRESSVAPEEDQDTADAKSNPWRIPSSLDPEWIAFEVYSEAPDSDSDDAEVTPAPTNSSPPRRNQSSQRPSVDANLTNALSHVHLSSPSPSPSPQQLILQPRSISSAAPSPGLIKTSLSLLEMLIRLTALQQFRQDSHLAIDDELLNFFLEDSSTTGAGPDAEQRRRVRRYARQRVGFDPYDESPIKRRGEEYIQHPPPEHYYEGSPAPSQYEERFDSGYGPPWPGADSSGNMSPRYETRPRDQRTSSPSLVSSPTPGYFSGARPSSSRASTPSRAQSNASSPMTPPGSTGLKSPIFTAPARGAANVKSPLGREVTSSSTLGTSPTLAGSDGARDEKGA
ncbi:MAG: hypothetical protein M1820_003858 [Bogoriella megaspora]|nr:MAG: hypothetical protein M1820_003858 [Bogoriella megaspora]